MRHFIPYIIIFSVLLSNAGCSTEDAPPVPYPPPVNEPQPEKDPVMPPFRIVKIVDSIHHPDQLPWIYSFVYNPDKSLERIVGGDYRKPSDTSNWLFKFHWQQKRLQHTIKRFAYGESEKSEFHYEGNGLAGISHYSRLNENQEFQPYWTEQFISDSLGRIIQEGSAPDRPYHRLVWTGRSIAVCADYNFAVGVTYLVGTRKFTYLDKANPFAQNGNGIACWFLNRLHFEYQSSRLLSMVEEMSPTGKLTFRATYNYRFNDAGLPESCELVYEQFEQYPYIWTQYSARTRNYFYEPL